MSIFDRNLWADSVRHPYRRLAIGLIGAPVFWGIVGSMFAYVVGSMSRPTAAETGERTVDVILVIFGGLFVFTFTLGLLGVLILWAAKLRSSVAWAGLGGVMGAVVAAINVVFVQGVLDQTLLIVFVVIGWAMFLTIRWFAGIKDVAPPARSSSADN